MFPFMMKDQRTGGDKEKRSTEFTFHALRFIQVNLSMCPCSHHSARSLLESRERVCEMKRTFVSRQANRGDDWTLEVVVLPQCLCRRKPFEENSVVCLEWFEIWLSVMVIRILNAINGLGMIYVILNNNNCQVIESVMQCIDSPDGLEPLFRNLGQIHGRHQEQLGFRWEKRKVELMSMKNGVEVVLNSSHFSLSDDIQMCLQCVSPCLWRFKV